MDPTRARLAGPLSRRDFLRAGARWGAVAAAAAATPFALTEPAGAQGVVFPKKEKLIVRSARYMDLEMPVNLIDSWLTPVELFYVRNHMELPSVNLAEWKLEVTGEVERTISLAYADLAQWEQAAVTNTLECAGNGRSFYRPRAPGIQWVRGAVGNARFAGPRLRDVLLRAGLSPGVKHIAFLGLDEPPGQVPKFVRSIPIEKAMHPDTLLATQMNGAPLRIEHGYPVRALVPGWLGAASVKWLVEIRALDRPFDGNFMKPGYSLPNRPLAPGEPVSPDDLVGITALPVKSIITQPGDGSWWVAGAIPITGAAWAGEADVASVDVSTDFGRTWQSAKLGQEQAHYAWRFWEHQWTPPGPGSYVLLSRATDSSGHTQPLVPSWNPSGYLWNVVDQVRVHVAA